MNEEWKSTYTFGLKFTVDDGAREPGPIPGHGVKIGVYDLLVNLQDLLSFRVTVGLSIFRNMIFVSLCRLVDKELISAL